MISDVLYTLMESICIEDDLPIWPLWLESIAAACPARPAHSPDICLETGHDAMANGWRSNGACSIVPRQCSTDAANARPTADVK